MLPLSSRKYKMRFFFRLFSSRSKQEDQGLTNEIKKLTDLSPNDLDLYKLAFRHSSADKHKKISRNNERLEFLGDAILSAVVADYLYKSYPDKNEGFLTSMRSKIVSRNNLNEIANNLQLDNLIVSNLDKRKKAKSISGDALEALIGAIYLDLGIDCASDFIRNKILKEKLSISELENQVISYKSKFIEWAQKERKNFEFILIDSWGLDHNKTFEMGITIDNTLISKGQGASKKIAEEAASYAAFQQITSTA